jgi:hypothetical protein
MADTIDKSKLKMAMRNVRNLRYILEILESKHLAQKLLVNF